MDYAEFNYRLYYFAFSATVSCGSDAESLATVRFSAINAISYTSRSYIKLATVTCSYVVSYDNSPTCMHVP